MEFLKSLPKKFNEYNYFKKEEQGCTLISFSEKKRVVIECRLEDFDIEQDFCIDDNAINMLLTLQPIISIKVDNLFIIKSKKGSFKAKLLEKKPNNIINDYEKKVVVEKSRLLKASKFISDNDSKPILCGVCVTEYGDLYSTDSYKAFRYLARDLSIKNYSSITIPKDFIELICKECGNNIEIEYNSNMCCVKNNNIKYISPLYDGVYPNIDQIYNIKNNQNKLVFDMQDFLDKLNIAKQVRNDLSNKSIALTFNNNKLIATGDDEFEADLINIREQTDYCFTLTMSNFANVISCFNQEEKFIEFGYISNVRPIFIEDDKNEILVLPIKTN